MKLNASSSSVANNMCARQLVSNDSVYYSNNTGLIFENNLAVSGKG